MLPLFASAIFVSAALHFVLQPLAGKVFLPLLGGSPAVWNVCMLFFQGTLLLGYLYAHVLTARAKPRVQAIVHALVLIAVICTLPIPIAVGEPKGASPVWWLLRTLAWSVGPAFFAVSTTAPLLQAWFARTGNKHAKDPYFLYAASNAGSAIGLLAYPFVIEPSLTRGEQSRAWAWGLGALAMLIVSCGVAMARASTRNVATLDDTTSEERSRGLPPLGSEGTARLPIALWLVLAAVPTSLMLGVTQHISVDLAPVPLLWIVPLFLYLLTFVLAFSKRKISADRLGMNLPVFVIVAAITLLLLLRRPMAWLIPIHLVAFFVAALMLHTRLADARPDAKRLTTYYLVMSLGGVLGGAFNTLLAPVVFRSLLEYPIALGAACLLTPQAARAWRSLRSRGAEAPATSAPSEPAPAARASRAESWIAIALSLALASLAPLAALSADTYLNHYGIRSWAEGYFSADRAELVIKWFGWILRAGVPCVIAVGLWVFARRGGALRFGLAMLGLLVASHFVLRGGNVLHRDRNFFGTLNVARSGNQVHLSHGTTLHGVQVRPDPIDLDERAPTQAELDRVFFGRESEASLRAASILDRLRLVRYIPGTYYHPSGPIGNVIESMVERGQFRNIALVGLGSGTLAAYARPGTSLTYFEIDPHVIMIASNPAWFTYLHDATRRVGKGVIDFRLGDARLSLAAWDGPKFDLIALDAFTSDAIPIHLLTLEAIRTYMKQLNDGGVLAVHISNRHLNLNPVLVRAADELAAEVPGFVCRVREDDGNDGHDAEAKYASTWVVLARNEAALGGLTKDDRWVLPQRDPGFRTWTDDFSNIWSVMSW